MGELPLEIIVDRMLREYSVASQFGRQQVAYPKVSVRKKGPEGGRPVHQADRGKRVKIRQWPSLNCTKCRVPHHENMHELSTDDIDELAKKISRQQQSGQWKFDKEHPSSYRQRLSWSIPREFIGSI